jgi:CRP-like cAMP-binding protein
VVVGVFARGDSFAEAVMFTGGRFPVSADAAAPSRVLRVDGAALRAQILAEPPSKCHPFPHPRLHSAQESGFPGRNP